MRERERARERAREGRRWGERERERTRAGVWKVGMCVRVRDSW